LSSKLDTLAIFLHRFVWQPNKVQQVLALIKEPISLETPLGAEDESTLGEGSPSI
jgi:DNA-directed RNA polymerase sigma subunit (sigma70/sigma32)